MNQLSVFKKQNISLYKISRLTSVICYLKNRTIREILSSVFVNF